MMSTISLKRAAFHLIGDGLARLGFEKRRVGLFSSTIFEDVIGWIGLNTATRHLNGALEVNPVVGVRQQRIERLVAELFGNVFDKLIPPTFAGNIGYLSPAHSYLSFTFSQSSLNEEVAERLCEAVKAYGLPFMNSAANLRDLVGKMQTMRFGITDQLAERIPVGLWLLGETEQAAAFVEAKLATIGARSDPAALRYRKFAMKLNERLESLP